MRECLNTFLFGVLVVSVVLQQFYAYDRTCTQLLSLRTQYDELDRRYACLSSAVDNHVDEVSSIIERGKAATPETLRVLINTLKWNAGYIVDRTENAPE